MKKIVFLSVIVMLTIDTYAQETKSSPDQNKIKFGLGYNIDLEALRNDVASQAGFSQFGINFLDIYGNITILKHLNLNLGIALGGFKDKSDLTETVIATGKYAFSN
jgi:hypothetical protein